ncbi:MULTISPECIES: hypothetical protein [unclassified Dietzia]|uniref:hypothetical protein n=1 Tax=unclassified Dietzia TaxID=2617939 RepID=UPI0012E762F0|nr:MULTISPECIES: hypothetical protein [unclassified Dietzia]
MLPIELEVADQLAQQAGLLSPGGVVVQLPDRRWQLLKPLLGNPVQPDNKPLKNQLLDAGDRGWPASLTSAAPRQHAFPVVGSLQIEGAEGVAAAVAAAQCSTGAK